MNKKIFLIISILLLIVSLSSAETIKMKSGKTIEGKIVERTDKYIKIDIGIGLPITYFLDEIESIDGKAILPTVEIKPSVSQIKTPNVLSKSETSPNTYINENYGVKITGPQGWDMEAIGKTVFEQEMKPVVDVFKKVEKDQSIVDEVQKRAMEMTYDDLGIPDSQRNIFNELLEKVKYLVIYHKEGKKEGLHTTIIVSAQDISDDKEIKTIQDYIEKSINESKQVTDNFKILEGPQEITLNGNRLIKLLSEFNYMNSSAKNLSYSCLKGNKIYELNCTSVPASDFESDYKYFQEAINSFVLK